MPDKFYYFNATHWDREWYQSFQEFRKYLVDMGAVLLDLLEQHPEYRHFTFDGQTIVLEDLLEIHPEWRPRLEAQIRAGRLKVGPWYVMPDELLVSGEALIRNLSTGVRIARSFGAEPWPVGYVCDMFGHIAQLPQILAGFGLVGIVGWRALYAGPDVHFARWRSPGGTAELPTLILSKHSGYGEFRLNFRDGLQTPLDEADFKAGFQKYVARNFGHWDRVWVLADGLDHDVPTADSLRYLQWIAELYPEAEVIHSDYADLLAAECAPGVPVMEGEQLRPADGPDNNAWQISATLSSRVDLKLANDLAQNELELRIEPEAASRAAAGDTAPLAMLRHQWHELLKNHAHDSICGCSIDQVHAAMRVRFDEVRAIGRVLHEEFIGLDRQLNFPTAADPFAADPRGEYVVRLYNPLPFATAALQRDLVLALPVDAPYPKLQSEPFGYQPFASFRLYDADGREIPYQLKRLERNRLLSCHRQKTKYFDLYTITAAPELRPSGWTTLFLGPSADVVRNASGLATGPRSADNGILALEIHSDGTFDLTDHRSGRRYAGLNDFEFDREIGDGWNHVEPVGGRRVTGGGFARITLIQNGGECTEFEIRRIYELPRRLDYRATVLEQFSTITESAETCRVELVTTVALDRGSDRLRWSWRLDNRLEDFRLRQVIPTGIPGAGFCGQSFTMLSRPEGRCWGEESRGFPELESITKNFSGVIGKRDDRGGIAFLNVGGLHEAGFYPDAGHSIKITLMRTFRRTVQRNGEESGGELSGPLELHGALVCFPPETSASDLLKLQRALAAEPGCYLAAGSYFRGGNDTSFITVTGKVTPCALKPAAAETAGTAVLRVFNPESSDSSVEVAADRPIKRVTRCRPDETELGEIAVEPGGRSFKFTARPNEIITVGLEF